MKDLIPVAGRNTERFRERGVYTVHEPTLMNWGIRGGKPVSEIDIGFELNVYPVHRERLLDSVATG
ncbi:MAG TPA: hypothetical protein VKW78_14800 [Terriglobales bacterium]|nr:hypothetical protein [Terriglobales bacterium]